MAHNEVLAVVSFGLLTQHVSFSGSYRSETKTILFDLFCSYEFCYGWIQFTCLLCTWTYETSKSKVTSRKEKRSNRTIDSYWKINVRENPINIFLFVRLSFRSEEKTSSPSRGERIDWIKCASSCPIGKSIDSLQLSCSSFPIDSMHGSFLITRNARRARERERERND